MNKPALYFIAAMLSMMFGMWIVTPAEEEITYVSVPHPVGYSISDIDGVTKLLGFNIPPQEVVLYRRDKKTELGRKQAEVYAKVFGITESNMDDDIFGESK